MAERDSLQKLSDCELEQLAQEAQVELSGRQFQRDWEASWTDLEGHVIDRDQTVAAILQKPTDEEKKRWEGMTPEQIRADIDAYISEKEKEQIANLRFVAEVDSISRQIHINSSPRLAP